MPLEAARDLSVFDLLQVLDEKLSLESTRLQKTRPSLAEIESEVSTRCQPLSRRMRWQGLTVDPPAQTPRIQRTMCLEVLTLFTERIAAGEQVATGDPLPHRQRFHGRGRPGCELDHSADSCVPILARIHHLGPGKLDANIR